MTAALLGGSSMFSKVLEAPEGLTGLKLMVEHKPDVIVCDLEMPVCDGVRFLALKASQAAFAHVPVIMLTGEGDPERKVDLLVRGAADYVTKPFHPRELLARVQAHLRLKTLQEELLRANAHLEELSNTDGLTGLRNRRSLDETLAAEAARAVRYELPLSLILFDIDHFKKVNDEHGHQAGDRVLARVGEVIREGTRTTDLAARYGGEELAVLLPHTGPAPAAMLADRLRAAISCVTFPVAGLRVTASAGVASLDASGCPTALVDAADRALYAAKHEGRNCVRSATPATTQITRDRVGTRLRVA
jgi:diguanylate cyclase (GGDEF)-like protein